MELLRDSGALPGLQLWHSPEVPSGPALTGEAGRIGGSRLLAPDCLVQPGICPPVLGGLGGGPGPSAKRAARA